MQSVDTDRDTLREKEEEKKRKQKLAQQMNDLQTQAQREKAEAMLRRFGGSGVPLVGAGSSHHTLKAPVDDDDGFEATPQELQEEEALSSLQAQLDEMEMRDASESLDYYEDDDNDNQRMN